MLEIAIIILFALVYIIVPAGIVISIIVEIIVACKKTTANQRKK